MEFTDAAVETRELFDFENTVFSAYDRRQMLTAAREIEERAWRVGGGTLYVGFQRRDALADQKDVYERLATHRSVTVTVFIDDEWDDPFDDVTVVTDADGEIGDVWFRLRWRRKRPPEVRWSPSNGAQTGTTGSGRTIRRSSTTSEDLESTYDLG